jgi:hypothetical protein
MFQALIGISDRRENLSAKGFAAMSRQLFTTSGYDSPDKIMNLIQDVKQELATERKQRLNNDRRVCLSDRNVDMMICDLENTLINICHR